MAADESVGTLPEAVGNKQHRQPGYSQEHDESLDLETLRSAKPPYNIGEDTDDEEVAADQENRQGRSQHGARWVHVDLGEAGAHVGHHQQDTPDQERTRLDA